MEWKIMMNDMKTIPQEGCKYVYNSTLIDKEYSNAVFCEYGYTI